jgi:hypothetical protein
MSRTWLALAGRTKHRAAYRNFEKNSRKKTLAGLRMLVDGEGRDIYDRLSEIKEKKLLKGLQIPAISLLLCWSRPDFVALEGQGPPRLPPFALYSNDAPFTENYGFIVRLPVLPRCAPLFTSTTASGSLGLSLVVVVDYNRLEPAFVLDLGNRLNTGFTPAPACVTETRLPLKDLNGPRSGRS